MRTYSTVHAATGHPSPQNQEVGKRAELDSRLSLAEAGEGGQGKEDWLGVLRSEKKPPQNIDFEAARLSALHRFLHGLTILNLVESPTDVPKWLKHFFWRVENLPTVGWVAAVDATPPPPAAAAAAAKT